MENFNEFPQLKEYTDSDEVILANGDYPMADFATEILKYAKSIVCCDGAYRSCIEHGLRPSAIIGDGDSLANNEKIKLKDLFHHNPDQETNDLTKAIHFAQEQGKKTILILGATGKREDHTLGNISLLYNYFTENLNIAMLTDHGLFKIYQGNQQFTSFPGQQISLFNIDCTALKSEGLVYPVYPFHHLWEGTLNESLDNSFKIHANGIYLMFFLAGKKSLHN